jgi:hypothetical protein
MYLTMEGGAQPPSIGLAICSLRPPSLDHAAERPALDDVQADRMRLFRSVPLPGMSQRQKMRGGAHERLHRFV